LQTLLCMMLCLKFLKINPNNSVYNVVSAAMTVKCRNIVEFGIIDLLW